MNDQTHSHKSIELWKVLTAIAVVGSTLAGAGWVAGRAYLSDEISQYKESEKWKAPDAIRKLSLLSEKLNAQLDSISDYETLKKDKKNLENRVVTLEQSLNETKASFEEKIIALNLENNEDTKNLNREIASFKKQETELNAKIAQLHSVIEGLRGEIVVVMVGQAESVGHKSIRVGVTRTTTVSNYASVTSGDYDNSTMGVGDNFSRTVEGKKYVITLVKISSSSAGFSFDVFESKEP
ncbi:hypothetical protein [Aeromonas caviae]|uniref:hypothetical protein n=1 Tax=Aeromonas caviae TaxID=648 RepID=UPI0038D11333